MKRTIILDIITSLFILLFLYTGVNKIIDHQRFDWALHKSPLLHTAAPVLAWLVPVGEISIAISLLIPRARRIGLISSAILMGIFTIYVGFMLSFRNDRPCTCGGIIEYMNWHQHLYFNLGFTVMGLLALKIDKKLKQSKIQNSIQYIS